MIILIAAVAGAFTGGTIAQRRKGNRADIAQYAIVYMMMFALIALFITLIIHRMSV